ncbi:MAG TPA: DJ-1 family glyoxalase III [Nitrospirota bacterium]|nr:DJ-1 family glyoxalase III [Nitrospirota bacterium]
MPRVAVILADGFEEVEAMAVIDVLRRAEIDTVVAGLHDGAVTSARKVRVLVDAEIDTIQADVFDMIVLPGGQPGSDNLKKDERVKDLLQHFAGKGKLMAAICAAPIVLENAGLLKGKNATSFPSYREKLSSAIYQEKAVVVDGNIVTSRGPGTALTFGLAIVERLLGAEKAKRISEAMLVTPA